MRVWSVRVVRRRGLEEKSPESPRTERLDPEPLESTTSADPAWNDLDSAPAAGTPLRDLEQALAWAQRAGGLLDRVARDVVTDRLMVELERFGDLAVGPASAVEQAYESHQAIRQGSPTRSLDHETSD